MRQHDRLGAVAQVHIVGGGQYPGFVVIRINEKRVDFQCAAAVIKCRLQFSLLCACIAAVIVGFGIAGTDLKRLIIIIDGFVEIAFERPDNASAIVSLIVTGNYFDGFRKRRDGIVIALFAHQLKPDFKHIFIFGRCNGADQK